MPNPKLENLPCQLSAAAYSVYQQLPSKAVGCSSIPNPRRHHAVVTRDPPNELATESKKKNVKDLYKGIN
jgi:hypothetical protein